MSSFFLGMNMSLFFVIGLWSRIEFEVNNSEFIFILVIMVEFIISFFTLSEKLDMDILLECELVLVLGSSSF